MHNLHQEQCDVCKRFVPAYSLLTDRENDNKRICAKCDDAKYRHFAIAEAQRQGAQKLASELRAWAVQIRQWGGISGRNADGVTAAMELLQIRLDELCPPVICDDPASPEPLTVADYVTVE